MCNEIGCKVRPTFNFTEQTQAIYCATHKKEGMVDVKHKTCLDCDVRPAFNFLGEKKAIYCSTHKKEGMVDIIHKTCLDCDVRPAFNFPGKKQRLYCSTHKKEGMVDVKNTTCLECDKIPAFNFPGKKQRLYCSTHKKEGMVDVVNKTCLDCDVRPTFNFTGQTQAIYCSTHKKEGMVNVVNKTCLECDKQPSFNFPSEKRAIYCAIHKKEGMVNVVSKTCLDCDKIPSFNFTGQTRAIYCATHKKEGMVDVVSKTCLSEWCTTLVKEKYEGYCLFCYMNLFPDKPVSRNYKTKEYAIVEHVKTKFSNFDWIADKKIAGGCSKRRPDLLLDLVYQIVIIEIDENQHIDYDCSCENRRTMELSQDLGHRPIVFIRFNPDDYKQDGQNISSCWGINKQGICVVKKSKQQEWNDRLNALDNTIAYWLNPENTTEKTVEVVQLFYDV